MKTTLRYFGFLFSMTMIYLAPAGADPSAGTDCLNRFEKINQTQMHQLENNKKNNCFISIENTNNYATLIYRSYVVSKNSLLVFVSLNSDLDNPETGAKEFYFFPRDVKQQSYVASDDQSEILVNSRFDFDFLFDAQTSQLKAVSNAELKIEDDFSSENDTGITMFPRKGLIYELPYTYNSAPSSQLKHKGYFKDAFNNQCTVQVGQIFKSIGGGDTEIKYSDAELQRLLKRICPQLVFSLN